MVKALKLEDKLLWVCKIVFHEACQLLLFVVRNRLLLTFNVSNNKAFLHSEHLSHYIANFEKTFLSLERVSTYNNNLLQRWVTHNDDVLDKLVRRVWENQKIVGKMVNAERLGVNEQITLQKLLLYQL